MSEITEAAKARRAELCEHPEGPWVAFTQFIQDVSDAAKEATAYAVSEEYRRPLAPFILPDPVDPLREVVDLMLCGTMSEMARKLFCEDFRAELAKRGLVIARKSENADV